MKQGKIKYEKKIILIIVFSTALYLLLPNFIHWVYKNKTTDKELIENRKLYNTIANKLNSESSSLEIEANKKTLDSLYLWFHVRGVPIDEDHFAKTKNEQWVDIFTYWQQ